MKSKIVLNLLISVLMTPALLSAQTPATPVIALQNLAHAVDSLEKTVPFYRDVLGLPVNGARDPLTAQPQALDDNMSKFTATKGAKFRGATFRIPNASFGFELTEFTGTSRKPAQPKLQDIGAAMLTLQVRDMDKMFAKLKAAGAPVVTIGGAPVSPGGANSKTREVIVRDPDGFFVAIVQPDPLPASAATAMGDILGGSVQLSIEDSAKSVAFLRAAIGFNAQPTAATATNPVVANLIGLPGSQWRITHGSIPVPNTSVDFALIEYMGAPKAKVVMGAEDPGSPAFTMVVKDIDAAVDQWTKAGGTVLTTGGKAIKQPTGMGNVFVRDVNGFTWELIQRAGQ